MAKIETLTPAQWQQMRDFREEQRRRALCTDTINEEAARTAVKGLYAAAGQKEPEHVFCFQSPLQCLMARGLLKLGGANQLGSQLWSQLWSQLGSQLWSQLESQLDSQLWSQLGSQLRSQLWSQLESQLDSQLWSQLGSQLRSQLWSQLESQLGSQIGSQLWSQLGSQLRSQLWSQLRSQLWSQLESQLDSQLWSQLGSQLWSQLWSQLGSQLASGELWQGLWFVGGWDSYWLAFYEFGRSIGATYSKEAQAHLDAYRTYADTCGVAFLYPNVALVSDRPERMSFDHLRRLHADDGPALLYRDGYAVYAWHGQRVEADVIEKRHEITAKSIKAEKNAEMRRVLVEIYAHLHGPGRIIQDMGATLLSEDTAQGRPRRLYEVDGNRFIHVINGSLEPDGTRREFFLGADPEAATPHDAIAASYGRAAGQYREAVRT